MVSTMVFVSIETILKYSLVLDVLHVPRDLDVHVVLDILDFRDVLDVHDVL